MNSSTIKMIIPIANRRTAIKKNGIISVSNTVDMYLPGGVTQADTKLFPIADIIAESKILPVRVRNPAINTFFILIFLHESEFIILLWVIIISCLETSYFQINKIIKI